MNQTTSVPTEKGNTMDNVKRIQELLEMHCYFRIGAWDCACEYPHICTECLAKHLVSHGVTVSGGEVDFDYSAED